MSQTVVYAEAMYPDETVERAVFGPDAILRMAGAATVADCLTRTAPQRTV